MNDDDTERGEMFYFQGNSENMLFERITASGVGLTIGSIGNSHVNNITFRDCYMPHSFKGIYMKFRGGDTTEGGRVSNVLYENIYMEAPEQWAIWIGPAQQSGVWCVVILWSYCGLVSGVVVTYTFYLKIIYDFGNLGKKTFWIKCSKKNITLKKLDIL